MTQQLNLIDDGRSTYRALRLFEWGGEVIETPFGAAAYVGSSPARPMATARVPHAFFGCANGRTWSQLSPIMICANSEQVRFDINRQDIVAISDAFGGGYIGYGRHDLAASGTPTVCAFGQLHQTRYSRSEAKHRLGHSHLDFTRGPSWMDQWTPEQEI